MKLGAKRKAESPEDQLRTLADAIEDAEADLAKSEAEVEAADALEAELSELSADEYLGTIEPGEYDHGTVMTAIKGMPCKQALPRFQARRPRRLRALLPAPGFSGFSSIRSSVRCRRPDISYCGRALGPES